jgi:hypothetical protein
MEAAPLQGSSCPVPKMPHSDALEGSRYISHSLWTQLRDSAQCSDFSHDLCLQAREREVASLLLDQWNWELKGASVSVPCYPLQRFPCRLVGSGRRELEQTSHFIVRLA